MKRLNKKGFTLVELLAVIAILAILMLLVTPNILKLFSDGKKDAFITQVQSVWKAAEQQYMSESITASKPGPYCSDTSDAVGCTKLNISGGNSAVKYYVTFDKKGDIDDLIVTDGIYVYDKDDAISAGESLSPKEDWSTIDKVAAETGDVAAVKGVEKEVFTCTKDATTKVITCIMKEEN